MARTSFKLMRVDFGENKLSKHDELIAKLEKLTFADAKDDSGEAKKGRIGFNRVAYSRAYNKVFTDVWYEAFRKVLNPQTLVLDTVSEVKRLNCEIYFADKIAKFSDGRPPVVGRVNELFNSCFASPIEFEPVAFGDNHFKFMMEIAVNTRRVKLAVDEEMLRSVSLSGEHVTSHPLYKQLVSKGATLKELDAVVDFNGEQVGLGLSKSGTVSFSVDDSDETENALTESLLQEILKVKL